MARMMTYRMAMAIKEGLPRVFLAEIGHPSGTGYYWTGIGPLEYGGHTWTGMGILGAFSPIKYTSDLQAQDITFSVSGISSDAADRLSASIRGYYGKLWMACIDGPSVVADPVQIAVVQFDTQKISVDEGSNATISIVGQPAFYHLTRSTDEVWSPERQKRTYPSDTGLDGVPGIKNKEVIWAPT